MKAQKVIGISGLLLLLYSCAPSKAYIDYTLAEGIIWPGPPETPRIKYLFSIRQIKGGSGSGKFLRFLTGESEYDALDPRYSDSLNIPHGVFLDRLDTLYITDPGGGRVVVVNLKDNNSFIIHGPGKTDFQSPIGVVAGKERIYVSDPDLKRVSMFSKKGKFIKYFEGEFMRPTGIALSPGGSLYVVDTWAHMVYIYDAEGKRLGSFGKRGEAPGEFNHPTHITVDRDGTVYVADTLNFRVQMFSPTGALISTFGLIGDSYGEFDKIKGIAVDSEGHIYVVDSRLDMVQVYDRQGRLLLFFGKEGGFYGDFSLPTGIFIDEKDRIFVSDSANGRVQAFQFLGGD